MHKVFVILLLALNSQVFFSSGGNQMGIRGFQEVFIGFLILFSFYYLFKNVSAGKIDRYDTCIYLVTGTFYFASVIFATIKYGQPLVYGMIESRIVLSLLIYFPIVSFLRDTNYSTSRLIKFVVATTVVIVFVALLIRLGIFPSALLSVPPVESGMDLFRKDRNSMGRYYIIFTALISFAIYIRYRKLEYLLLYFICLAAALFIVQERQNVIGIVAASLVFLAINSIALGRLSLVLKVISGFAVVSISVYYLFPQLTEFVVGIFSKLRYEELVDSLRYRELETIYQEMKPNPWVGHGALSLLWESGFHRYFGTFFIGDVGIFGTIFRLGIPLALLVWLYMGITFGRAYVLARTSVVRDLVLLSLLFIIFTFPTSAPLGYRGYFVGLVLALLVGQLRLESQNRRSIKRAHRNRG